MQAKPNAHARRRQAAKNVQLGMVSPKALETLHRHGAEDSQKHLPIFSTPEAKPNNILQTKRRFDVNVNLAAATPSNLWSGLISAVHVNEKDSMMRNLNYELRQLCQRNRDGSFSTQACRERSLSLCANQLNELGFKHLNATSLKPKHIEALITRWQSEKISAGTIKNRLSHLRWWAEKINKISVVAKSNDSYGVANRQYVTNISKSRDLGSSELSRVSDPYSRLSLQLQAAFGLRREESIKLQPAWADRGDHLMLKESWTKGGRARSVPIRTTEQRELLNQAKQLAGKGSLIPDAMNYKQQLNRFRHQCEKAGIHGVHGHRHHYAQQRYLELTGWAAPAAGGPTSKQLSPEQKALDCSARLAISQELGHEREQITAVYLGR